MWIKLGKVKCALRGEEEEHSVGTLPLIEGLNVLPSRQLSLPDPS